jgi:hypothetical protein
MIFLRFGKKARQALFDQGYRSAMRECINDPECVDDLRMALNGPWEPNGLEGEEAAVNDFCMLTGKMGKVIT